VHIRLAAEAGQVAVWVTDNGAGIPDGDLAQLFQRHFRGVQAATAIPGTGLGLSIARELMQQMQGEIQVFSPLRREGWLGEEPLPESRGVTFVVTLAAIG
jgi:signal transduction histidine kinase